MTEHAKLNRCPLCGADSGYSLHEGSTSKYLAIHCRSCGEQVSECRSDYVDPPEGREEKADEAWNEAGKYAQGLLDEVERLRALLRDISASVVKAKRVIAKARHRTPEGSQ